MQIIRGVAPLVALVLCVGCASSPTRATQAAPSSRAAPPSVTVTVSTPATSAAIPDASLCAEVETYIKGHIVPTMDSWDVNAAPFAGRIVRQLRAEGTRLFALEAEGRQGSAAARATDAVAQTITDLSVALEDRDLEAAGHVATRASTALARVRGACGF